MDLVVLKGLRYLRHTCRNSKSRRHKTIQFSFTFFFLTLVSIPHFASARQAPHALIPYYGEDFYVRLREGERDEKLIESLRRILVSKHVSRNGEFDEITSSCDSAARNCYGHQPLGYGSARKVIMGELHLFSDHPKSNFGISEVYCEKDYTREDFPEGPFPGPGVTPNHTVINVEHTWPQSRFNRDMDPSAQKSDLHHLFPTDSQMNSSRGNLEFAEVDISTHNLRCPGAKVGFVKGSHREYFEPPDSHKGNVARALFYFSIRYRMPISGTEEAFLKKWNEEDPVDPEEATRNEQIQKIQGNRNPFIDFPDLARKISDF